MLFRSVAASEYNSAARTNLGRLFIWGSNEKGQLGQRDMDDTGVGHYADLPQLVRLSDSAQQPIVTKVVMGNFHVTVLTEDGRVYTFGGNQFGQLGLGETDTLAHPVPQRVTGLSKVIDISEGGKNDTVHVVRYDGTLWGWGSNQIGRAHV